MHRLETERFVQPCVLVINDSQTTLNLYADLLESDNYELELSNYEFEEPEMIERLKPALILLDFQVDQLNRTRGWQLLDKIKLFLGEAEGIPRRQPEPAGVRPPLVP